MDSSISEQSKESLANKNPRADEASRDLTKNDTKSKIAFSFIWAFLGVGFLSTLGIISWSSGSGAQTDEVSHMANAENGNMASSAPSPTPQPSPTAAELSAEQGQQYIQDTEEQLQKTSAILNEFFKTILAVRNTPRSEQYDWQKRLDAALLDVTNEGCQLREMPVGMTTGEDVSLPKAVTRLREKREALGYEMTDATYDLREAMPLLTEPDDNPPSDPEKVAEALKRFNHVKQLYQSATAELSKARYGTIQDEK